MKNTNHPSLSEEMTVSTFKVARKVYMKSFEYAFVMQLIRKGNLTYAEKEIQSDKNGKYIMVVKSDV